jgi:hypothetical protein
MNLIVEPRQFSAGDYAGLAADVNGTFHAFWIDNRTGISQIWTAPIVVDGRAVRNGDVTLSQLKDVSHDVELEIVSSRYDGLSNTVRLGARLKNWSQKSIHGPLKLRLTNIGSRAGNPVAVNADNHLDQPGAVWDFSFLLSNNTLEPEEESGTKLLMFRINGFRGFFDGDKLHTGVLNFDTRVLAEGEEELARPVRQKSSGTN